MFTHNANLHTENLNYGGKKAKIVYTRDGVEKTPQN